MPCPHCKITIIKQSENESAVSAAAYQSGEKLFSEYDQEQKYYPYKNEVTHKEIMLPPHVLPEFADRNTLWNSAEAQEKQWNSQLARRFVLAIPREIPSEQYADLIRDYCREFFVSKGMIADFAIHDKGDGPHAHILLTMRAMEKKGIQTNIGNLNRDIKSANSLMQSIRQMVRHLKGRIADLKEKKAALMEALEQTKEPTIPELLSQYLELRSGQRAGWTSRGKLKGTVADFNKVQAAMDFLRKKEISTLESLDIRLDEISQTAVSVMESVKKSEKRIKAIDTMLSYIDKYEANKPVHKEYAAIDWKKKKEQFAESHREGLDAYNAAIRYFKANLKGRQERIRQEQAGKQKPSRIQKQQNMEL